MLLNFVKKKVIHKKRFQGINLEELVDDVKKLKATVRKVCRRLNSLEKQLGEVVADDVNEEEEE